MEQDESTIGTNRLANAFAAAFKPLIPPNTGSDASSSSSSSSSLKRNNEPPPFDTEQIIVENGSTATTRSQNRITSSIFHQRTMKHRQTNDNVTNAIDMEAEQRAMLTVIETIANYTLEKFSNQIERKMAEEFNVYGFQVRERFDQTEEYFGKVARISKHLLDANEQITTNIFELKDQIREEQTLMESVEMRLNKMLQIKNEQQQQQNVSNTCHNEKINLTKLIDQQFKQLHQNVTEWIQIYQKNVSTKTNDKQNRSNLTNNDQDTIKMVWKNPIQNNKQQYITIMADSTIESLPNKSKNNNNRKEMDQSRMVKIDEFNEQQQQQRSTSKIDESIRTTKIVARKSSSSSIRPQFEPLVNHDQCSRSHQIPFPKSCDQLRLNGVTCDGMYTIVMDTFMMKHLFCDQSHMGGGWTVSSPVYPIFHAKTNF